MSFRSVIVQPIAHRPGADEQNVADAVPAIEPAAHAARILPACRKSIRAVAHAGRLRSGRGRCARAPNDGFGFVPAICLS